MASRRTGTGQTPSAPTMWPTKLISCPISSFFLDRIMQCCRHLCSTCSMRCRSSSLVGACTRMSSTSSRTPGSPARASSHLWHGALDEGLMGPQSFTSLTSRSSSSPDPGLSTKEPQNRFSLVTSVGILPMSSFSMSFSISLLAMLRMWGGMGRAFKSTAGITSKYT